MCNLASTSAYYINRQLETLWQIATASVPSDSPEPSTPDTDYTLLAQIYVGTPENVSFCATFGTPQLKFLCNHAAVLQLLIKSGHYQEDGCDNM